MKILIVKLSSIGDVLHALPVLSAIRRALPNAEISWIVEKSSAEILRGNPLISHLIEIDTKAMRRKTTVRSAMPEFSRQLLRLRAERFDVALDFQGLLKSATIAKLSKAPRRYGFSKDALREPTSRFLLTDTVAVSDDIHIVRKNLALAAAALRIPVPNDDFVFPVFSDSTHQKEASAIIDGTGAKFAILNPATSWATKMWDAAKFGQLADKIWENFGLMSVVTTAPNETTLAQKVLESSKSGKVILSAPSLKGFYELSKQTEIYVGGDTGPTFLAIAGGAPVVGIFGPTEWRRNGSPQRDDIAVERHDIACRINCHRRTCDNWICLDIWVETVLRAVEKRLRIGKQKEVTIG